MITFASAAQLLPSRSSTARLSATLVAFALALSVWIQPSAVLSRTSSDPVAVAFLGKRGIGGMRTFFFPRQSPRDSNRYDTDPYQDWNVTMPRSRLDEIREAGFDFIRLVIDPGPLLESEGEGIDKHLSKVKAAIESTLGANLRVLVDIHVSANHPLWGFLRVTAGFDDPAFKRYLGVLAKFGTMLSAYEPTKVALELFNEPPPPCKWRDRPDWPDQLAVIYKVARAAAPKHTLFVSGSCWASIEGLAGLDGSKFDDNSVFVFHYYEPFVFTHQSFWAVASMRFLEHLSRLSYPPDAVLVEEQLRAVKERVQSAPSLSASERRLIIADATRYLHRYVANWKGKANIETDFEKVRQWTRRYGIPPGRILLGEFGVMRDAYGHKGADPGARFRWLSDVRQAAESFGYSWAAWELTGPMAITVEDSGGRLDTGVLGALGLKSRQ